ncbi:MAG: SDR family oxidoreductase [Magnetococcales bacterium]|nr:SDR family oxidoreductase [Magnetococcales bacterium]
MSKSVSTPGDPSNPTHSVRQALDLSGRVAVITGGGGLLGVQHGEAIAEMGGIPVVLDLDGESARGCAENLAKSFDVPAMGMACDITRSEEVEGALVRVLERYGRVDILINNAANNPKVEDDAFGRHGSRLEEFSLDTWNQDLNVGLTGAFLCSRVFGAEMARRGKGVILNMASDLAIIAPDQRIYQQAGKSPESQPVKPVTYSVVKAGLLGLTRYLATYWADQGVRSNALLPGGVFAEQDQAFLEKLTRLIPMGRMAEKQEYKAAVVFLVSDASSYMNGATLSMDGGRTCW